MRGSGRDPFSGVRGSFGGSFGAPSSAFIDNHQGPETDSVDEKEGGEGEGEKKGQLGKHERSISKAETESGSPRAAEGRNRKMQNMNVINNGQWQPRTCSYSFHTSIFSGHNGNNLCASPRTRRTGSNVLTTEDSNTATLEAVHRVSRSLHNKGHTVARKVNSDTRQDLGNSADESADFEESLSGNGRRGFAGRSCSFGSSSSNLSPSRVQTESSGRAKAAVNERGHGRA